MSAILRNLPLAALKLGANLAIETKCSGKGVTFYAYAPLKHAELFRLGDCGEMEALNLVPQLLEETRRLRGLA
jgi:hypothetical protein